jgi:hypothetical protein
MFEFKVIDTSADVSIPAIRRTKSYSEQNDTIRLSAHANSTVLLMLLLAGNKQHAITEI